MEPKCCQRKDPAQTKPFGLFGLCVSSACNLNNRTLLAHVMAAPAANVCTPQPSTQQDKHIHGCIAAATHACANLQHSKAAQARHACTNLPHILKMHGNNACGHRTDTWRAVCGAATLCIAALMRATAGLAPRAMAMQTGEAPRQQHARHPKNCRHARRNNCGGT